MAFCSSSGRRVALVCLIFVNLTLCGRASNGETRKSGAAARQDPAQAAGQVDRASGAEDPSRITDEGGGGTASSVSAKEASTSENSLNNRLRPVVVARIRMCTADATGQPCSPMVPVYADPALSRPLADSPITDAQGNYSFYSWPGRYIIEVSGPQIATAQISEVIHPDHPTAHTVQAVAVPGEALPF